MTERVFVRYGDWDWTREGYHVAAPFDAFRDQWRNEAVLWPRSAAPPVLSDLQPSERRVVVDVSFPPSLLLEEAYDRFLGKIRPGDPTPRPLVLQRGDGTLVAVDAVVEVPFGAPDDEAHGVRATFLAVDPVWRVLTPAALTRTTTAAATLDRGMPLPLGGHATAYPKITISSSAVRATDSALYGWTKREVLTIENNSSSALNRFPWAVDLGDTAARVAAGEMREDGADVRFWHQGRDLPRAFMAWNSKDTVAWIIVDHLPAGESTTIDVVYDNADAAVRDSVPVLWYPDLPPFHSGGDWGRVTSATSTSIDCSDKSWLANQWAGASNPRGLVHIVAGTGAGQVRLIAANDPNTINVAAAWTTTPDATSSFYVQGGDSGTASAGTATTLTTSDRSWELNWWRGGVLTAVGGSGSGQSFGVLSNTNTAVTIDGTASPAFDNTTQYVVHGSDQGRWNYLWQNVGPFAGHGLWWIDRAKSEPGTVDFGVPGSWRRFLMLDNQDKQDAQRHQSDGANWWAGFEAKRLWGEDPRGLQDEGQADGVVLSHPLGIGALIADWNLINQADAAGDPIGKFVVLGREVGGEAWQTLYEDASEWGSVTATSRTAIPIPTPYPRELYMGVLPADGVAVAETATNLPIVGAQSHQNCTVLVDYAPLAQSLGSQEDIFDAYGSLRLGGGASATVLPYDVLHLGGSGGSGRLALPLNGKLEIDCAKRTVRELTSGGALVGNRFWAVSFRRHQEVAGAAMEVEAPEWFGVRAFASEIENANFTTDLSDWPNVANGGTITPTWSWESAITVDTAGDPAGAAHLGVAGSTTVGAFSLLQSDPTRGQPVVPGQRLTLSVWVRTANGGNNCRPVLAIVWRNAALGTISTTQEDFAAAANGVWYRRAVTGTAPAAAAFACVQVGVSVGVALATGDLYFDQVQLGGQDLFLADFDAGLSVAVELGAGYYA